MKRVSQCFTASTSSNIQAIWYFSRQYYKLILSTCFVAVCFVQPWILITQLIPWSIFKIVNLITKNIFYFGSLYQIKILYCFERPSNLQERRVLLFKRPAAPLRRLRWWGCPCAAVIANQQGVLLLVCPI